MIEKYYIEFVPYAVGEITIDETNINELVALGICKIINNGSSLVFTYVGVIIVNDFLVIVVPKYLRSSEFNHSYFNEHIKLVLDVLKTYQKNKGIVEANDLYDLNVQSGQVSDLSLSEALLQDYEQYGYLQKRQRGQAVNGMGSIDWTSTIQSLSPVFVENRPFYLEYITYNQTSISFLVESIHRWAIYHCYHCFSHLLNVENLDHDNRFQDLNQICSREAALWAIQRELNITYNDRSISVLKRLDALIRSKYFGSLMNMSLFGTKEYEYVWESALGVAFNKLEFSLAPPVWKLAGSKMPIVAKPLRPDIVRVLEMNSEKYLIIVDAKYYSIDFSSQTLIGYPKANDVAKQQVYEHGLSVNFSEHKIVNMFILPTVEKGAFRFKGTVCLPFISSTPILIVEANIENIYKHYIMNTKIDNQLLQRLCFSLISIRSSPLEKWEEFEIS